MNVTVEGIWSEAADNQINPTLQVTSISLTWMPCTEQIALNQQMSDWFKTVYLHIV